MRIPTTLAVTLSIATLFGCADKVPAKINLIPPGQITDQNPVDLGASVQNKSGEHLEEVTLAYSANPPGIANVSVNGRLTCIKSGQTTVEIAGGGLTTSVSVQCGIVDRVPAKISFVQPPVIVDKNPVNLGATVLNKFDEALTGLPFAYSANPGGIVEISQDGHLSCVKAGEVDVQILAANLKTSFSVRCLIVSKIKAPKSLDITIGRDVPPYNPKPVDEAGNPIDSVVSITTSAPEVISVDQLRLLPSAVGTAILTASSGGVAAETHVSVSKLVMSQPLAIRDGSSQTIAFQQGKYLVEVQVSAGKPQHGVTLSWVGANCPDQSERPAHKLICKVDGTATLTITNPALLGFGAPAQGFANITEVP